jgi:hypothetical protein
MGEFNDSLAYISLQFMLNIERLVEKVSDQTDIPNNSYYDLSSIDEVILTDVVRQLLNSPNATISDWKYDHLDAGGGGWGGLISSPYRFTGKAHDQDGEKSWSLVLKVVGTKATQDDPTHYRYWKREVLAYQSGDIANLPGKLVAPRFFGTYPFSEKVIGLWTEYVDDIILNWNLEHYSLVARYLGQFNGAFLTERKLPSSTWLSQGWLRQNVKEEWKTIAIDRLRQPHDQPAIRQWFKEGNDTRTLQLWDDREIFLDALDRLPQTLLHHDAFRRNLFIRHEQVVAIDWAFTGIGAIGEELVALVIASCFYSEFNIENIRELDRVLFEAYLEGLVDAGWRGDSRLARLGFTAGSAMLWGLGYVWFDPPAEYIPEIEQTDGRSIDEIRLAKKHVNSFVLDLADEARQLMVELKII